MGNNPSQPEKEGERKLGRLLDKIATKLIITQNFQDLVKLEHPEYCNKLVIVTSDIINQFLDNKNIDYLAQRIERGVVVNKMKKDKVIYFQKDESKNLDIRNSIKKKRMCIGIAQFYIKIGHVFSAILKTLNPEYVYKDNFGNIKRISILEKEKIPKNLFNRIENQIENATVKIPYTRSEGDNLCSRRIKALTPRNVKGTDKYKFRLCELNKPSLPHGVSGPLEKTRKFTKEVGIPELRMLYLDQYDFSVGDFTKMTPASKKQYKADVDTFYKAFTGNTSVPPEIKGFSQIPLSDFHNKPICRKKEGVLKREYKYDTKNKIYQPYAEHLAKMMKDAINNQNKLIAILNKIFIKEVDPATKKIEYNIDPKLTNKKLQDIVTETRKLIIELYTQCEKDFHKGLKLFEVIIEKKELDRNENRRKHLQNEFDSLLE